MPAAALPYIVRQRTLTDLAAGIGTLARYLGQRARKMGIPIRTWSDTPSIRDRRFELYHLRSAQAVLAAGNYSVRMIAKELGFSDRTLHCHFRTAARQG